MSSKVNYAIVKNGSGQSRVAPGERLLIDRVEGKKGDKVTLSEVLMLCSGDESKSFTIGTSSITGASVTATILRHTLADKRIVYKKKRRKGYTKKQGHRQQQTEVLIESIQA